MGPGDPITPQEFAKKLKEKHPQYKDVDDSTLVAKMLQKYPQYKDHLTDTVLRRPEQVRDTTGDTTSGMQKSFAQPDLPDTTNLSGEQIMAEYERETVIPKNEEESRTLLEDMGYGIKSTSQRLWGNILAIPESSGMVASTLVKKITGSEMTAEEIFKTAVEGMKAEPKENSKAPKVVDNMLRVLGNLYEGSAAAQDAWHEKSEITAEKMTQYETALGEDVMTGDWSQAGRRFLVGGVSQIPNIAVAAIPYAGPAALGLSSATDRLDQLQEETEGDISFTHIADAGMYGALEFTFERITGGMARQMIGRATKKMTSQQVKQFVDRFIKGWVDGAKEIGWGSIKEGGSEALTTIGQKITDAILLGDEVATQESLYELIESFGTGAVAGGGMIATGRGVQSARARAIHKMAKGELGKDDPTTPPTNTPPENTPPTSTPPLNDGQGGPIELSDPEPSEAPNEEVNEMFRRRMQLVTKADGRESLTSEEQAELDEIDTAFAEMDANGELPQNADFPGYMPTILPTVEVMDPEDIVMVGDALREVTNTKNLDLRWQHLHDMEMQIRIDHNLMPDAVDILPAEKDVEMKAIQKELTRREHNKYRKATTLAELKEIKKERQEKQRVERPERAQQQLLSRVGLIDMFDAGEAMAVLEYYEHMPDPEPKMTGLVSDTPRMTGDISSSPELTVEERTHKEKITDDFITGFFGDAAGNLGDFFRVRETANRMPNYKLTPEKALVLAAEQLTDGMGVAPAEAMKMVNARLFQIQEDLGLLTDWSELSPSTADVAWQAILQERNALNPSVKETGAPQPAPVTKFQGEPRDAKRFTWVTLNKQPLEVLQNKAEQIENKLKEVEAKEKTPAVKANIRKKKKQLDDLNKEIEKAQNETGGVTSPKQSIKELSYEELKEQARKLSAGEAESTLFAPGLGAAARTMGETGNLFTLALAKLQTEKGQKPLNSGEEEAMLMDIARKENKLYTRSEFDDLVGGEIGDGGESIVYHDPNNPDYVIKETKINVRMNTSYLGFFTRLQITNMMFPETAHEVVGLLDTSNGVKAILRQRKVNPQNRLEFNEFYQTMYNQKTIPNQRTDAQGNGMILGKANVELGNGNILTVVLWDLFAQNVGELPNLPGYLVPFDTMILYNKVTMPDGNTKVFDGGVTSLADFDGAEAMPYVWDKAEVYQAKVAKPSEPKDLTSAFNRGAARAARFVGDGRFDHNYVVDPAVGQTTSKARGEYRGFTSGMDIHDPISYPDQSPTLTGVSSQSSSMEVEGGSISPTSPPASPPASLPENRFEAEEDPSGFDWRKLLQGVPLLTYLDTEIIYKHITKPIGAVINDVMKKGNDNQYTVFRNISEMITALFPEFTRTQKEVTGKNRLRGELKNNHAQYAKVARSLSQLLGNDKEAARRVHAALDPELYGDEAVAYEDLNETEKFVFDKLREINQHTHERNLLYGFIDQETFDKYDGKYIGRGYQPHEDLAGEAMNRQTLFGIRILDEIYKRRNEIDQWMIDNKVEDPIYLTMNRAVQTERNIIVKEYADVIAKKFAKTEPKKGYVQLNGKKYGDLNGKYVPHYVAEDFKGYYFANSIMDLFHRAATAYNQIRYKQFMRKFFTVFQGTVQVGNFFSNYLFGFTAGINPVHMMYNNYEATKQLQAQEGQYYEEAVRAGILGTDIITQDLRGTYTDTEQQDLGVPEEVTPVTGVKAIDNTAVAKQYAEFDKMARQLYEGSDDVQKLSAYMALRQTGYTATESAVRVYQGFQNYAAVGRLWDLGAKLPVIGSDFIKFKGDLLRLVKNRVIQTPLTTVVVLEMIRALITAASHLSGEDDEDRKLREEREFIPKMRIPYGADIPLVARLGDKEINVARYLSPYYDYDTGPQHWTEKITALLPFEGTYIEETGEYRVMPSDVMLGGVWSAFVNNKDFRNKVISDPNYNIYSGSTVTDAQATINRMTYVLRSNVPLFSLGHDAYLTQAYGHDYYGRHKTPTDMLISRVIKVQTWDETKTKDQVVKKLRQLDFDSKKIKTDSSFVANNYNREIDKLIIAYDDGKITKEQFNKGYDKHTSVYYKKMLPITERMAETQKQFNELDEMVRSREGWSFEDIIERLPKSNMRTQKLNEAVEKMRQEGGFKGLDEE